MVADYWRGLLFLCVAAVLLVFVNGSLHPSQAADGPIQPGDLKYLGAFRLPGGSGGSSWTYSGNALAYYPDGDPDGAGDGYLGSLFGTGNGTEVYVSEISIPVPVVSPQNKLSELNTATTLQPFTDIFSGLFGYLEQPRVGMCYLPAQGSQSSGKVHFALGLHLQDTGFEASHGWFNMDLSNPQTAGTWIFGGYSGYITNDYMSEIPRAWADANTPGQYLATGRAREGPWSGVGPGLFGYGPWKDGNPPAAGTTLSSITPLMLYGEQVAGSSEISSNSTQQIPNYSDSDRWRAMTWITAGDRGAVVFAGTKALGESWYGFADGTRWPYDCAEPDTPPCPEVPDWPYEDRGYWADDLQAQLLFFDPDDLASVAQGRTQTWSPQPYAVMDLSSTLFDPDYTVDDLVNYKRDFVGAMTFDKQRGLLYLMEPVLGEDGESVIHVFRVNVN